MNLATGVQKVREFLWCAKSLEPLCSLDRLCATQNSQIGGGCLTDKWAEVQMFIEGTQTQV